MKTLNTKQLILLSVLAIVASTLVLGCTSATTVNNPTAAPTTAQIVPDNSAGTSAGVPTIDPSGASQIIPPDVPTTIPMDGQGAIDNSTLDNSTMDNAANDSSAIDNSTDDSSTVDNSTIDNGAADNSGLDNSTVDDGNTDNSSTDNGALPSDDTGIDTGDSTDNPPA